MPLDAITLTHLTKELDRRLAGARVDKIHMPDRNEVILALRAQEGNVRLLLSANQSGARLQITRAQRENPKEPPMFCMLLRKLFTGARLQWVHQEPLERIVRLGFESVGELGDLEQKVIVLELMGRSSNLLILDGDQRIIQALRYIDISEQKDRQIIPGIAYQLPKRPDKIDVTQGFDALQDCLRKPSEQAGDAYLVQHIMGISPLLARECVYSVCGRTDAPMISLTPSQREQLFEELTGLFIGQEAFPTLLLDADGTPAEFTCFAIRQYGSLYHLERPDSYSDLLDDYYALRDQQAHLKQRRQQLQKLLQNSIERTAKKLSIQQAERSAFKDREQYRVFGELLIANLHLVPRGAPSVSLPNYYDEDAAPVTIPLDIRISPSANAQYYFKRYQKAKNGEHILQEQLERGYLELEYLKSVLFALQQSQSEREIAAIREELAEQGYIARQKGPKQKQKRTETGRPLSFSSSEGVSILVGRNNSQNDLLVSQIGKKEDWWLHVLDLPGSHVLVQTEGRAVTDRTLTEAAQIAALYSSASEEDRVPVTYTKLRNVKKPSGAKPGYVIYTTSQTAFVKPDRALAERLENKGPVL